MFAKGKAIREAKKAEVLAKNASQAKAQERLRVEAVLSRHGVELDKEVADELFGNSRSD